MSLDHPHSYSIFTAIQIWHNETTYHTLNTVVIITISILAFSVFSYLQQQSAYSDSFIENLANSFFNHDNSVSTMNNNNNNANLSKFAANDVTNSSNVSSLLLPPQSQQLSMEQICLNSSTVRDEFVKQQCDATMYNKFLKSK